jgi:NADH-quinone oxidoreductase subunit G
LRTQRLDQPYIRENGRLHAASWRDAFEVIAAKVKQIQPRRMGAIVGDLAAVEEIFAFKDLMTRLGVVNLDCRQDGAMLDPTWGRASYLFNASIAGIEQADALLLVGTNPRREAAVLNARIRKRWRMGAFPIGLVGERVELTYPYEYLGAGPQTLADVASGAHEFGARLRQVDRPLVTIGMAALARPDGAAVAALAARAAQGSGKDAGWNGYSVLHTAAARVGALDLAFVPGPDGRNAAAMAAPGALDLVFLLGADEIEIAPGAFVVYIGTHGDAGAHRADVILPGAAYPEKSGIYVNTEGRVQMAARASFPPGEAREDWAILRALSDVLGRKLGYDSLAQLRRALFKAHPHLQRTGEIAPVTRTDVVALAARAGAFEKTAFGRALDDAYLTNPIARASAIMAECSVIAERQGALTAAE